MNMYAYVGNDPVNFTDPLGQDPDDIIVTGKRLNEERSLSKGDDQTYYETEAAGHSRPGGALMLEPGMRLFVVQCRHNGGEATTGLCPR